MWFSEVAEHPNPGPQQLTEFLNGVKSFLAFVLETNEFSFLWEDAPNLRAAANETFQGDVAEGVVMLQQAIERIPSARLAHHGLVGRPARFKFGVVESISRGWERVKGKFTVREWLKRVFEAIDAILDSLISAAGGVGGVIKEFKDALCALVKTTQS